MIIVLDTILFNRFGIVENNFIIYDRFVIVGKNQYETKSREQIKAGPGFRYLFLLLRLFRYV